MKKPTYEELEQKIRELEKKRLDHKRTEESLRLHSLTLRQIEDRVTVTDLEGNITYINNAAFRMLGMTREELIGQHISILGEDASTGATQEEIIRKTLQDGSWRGEVTNFRADRSTRVLDCRTQVVRSVAGQPIALCGISTDITERKQAEEALGKSEEKYRTLLETTSEGYTLLNPELKIVEVNDSICRMLGYSQNEMLGKTPFDLVDDENRKIFVEQISKISTTLHRSYEIILKKKNGQDLQAHFNATTIKDKSGEVLGSFALVTDMTDKLALEGRLRQGQKMEAIGTLAGGIAHDFNNILGAIIGLSELSLPETPEDSSLHRHIEKILEAGMRAKDLVQQILAFSRQRDQVHVPMSISPVIKEALKFLRSSLPSTIQIRHYIKKDLGLIKGDPSQIHQVLMNLCTNAEHAMREKGGTIYVKLGRVAVDETMATLHHDLLPGPYVRLEVKDTGYGIEPAKLERIFDPYFTTKGMAEGTGLGLAVVQGIMQKHEGAVTVETDPGKGTAFQVFFPVIEGEKEEIKEQVKIEKFLPSGNEHILLIDDEAVLAEVGKDILQHLGYKVTIRTSSTEALRLFKEKPGYFDLVITDMTMPNMTGEQLSREVIKIRQDIPIILCTGFSHIISKEKALEIGIKAFVMKPLAIKDLAEVVRRVLD